MMYIFFCLLGIFGYVTETAAHALIPSTRIDIWQWQAEPWVITLLILSLVLYIVGYLRLWRHAGEEHGARKPQLWTFCLGWLSLSLALVSPLDTLGNWLFSAHMLQHEILMIVSAPLIVLARPLSIWIWAFNLKWRLVIGRFTNLKTIESFWQTITQPFNAWILHAMALWLWHIPALFDAALRNNNIHALQHFSFLFSALLFWWSVIGKYAHAENRAWAMMSIFTTMLHTAALGILLTLANHSWYPAYDRTVMLGLSALEDQQLGGLIMWVPAGLAYLIAGLGIAAKYLTAQPKQAYTQSS